MVSSSKILTVSYGTFSCTLEGFDDSFDTMKHIAEYFRDLAADDRYFGAEPPTPDAEVLAKIAEREIARRVEAHEEQGTIVLRADGASAAPASPLALDTDQTTEQVKKASPVADVAPENAAEAMAQDTLEHDPASEVDTDLSTDTIVSPAVPVSGTVSEETPAEEKKHLESIDEPIQDIAEDVQQPTAATTGDDDDSVAARLRRIRSVVAQGTSELSSDTYSEDEHAQDFLGETVSELDAVLLTDDDAERDLSAPELVAAMETETALKAAPEILPDPEATAVDDLTEPDARIEMPAADMPAQDSSEDTLASLAAQLAGDTPEQNAEVMDEDDTQSEVADALEEDTLSQILADALPEAEHAVDASTDTSADTEQQIADDLTESASQDVDAESAEAQSALRTHVVKMDRAELEKAVAEGEMDEPFDILAEDLDAENEPADAILSAEDEAELMRELAAVEAELSQGPIENPQPATQDVNVEATSNDVTDLEAPLEDDPDEDETSALSHLTDTNEHSDVSRLFDKAESQLDTPESSERRNAIQHLRAAVAATKAEQSAGSDLRSEPDENPYRSDIANVVRPRRPEGAVHGGDRPHTRSQRPIEARPAPLKLVAEQRIDTDRSPVRPRRVATPQPADVVGAHNNPQGSFGEFAAQIGATTLPEMLEAAAAYMADVEGLDQFSRPMLFGMVKNTASDGYSREEALRSFGNLLRQGKLEKKKPGRFTVTDLTDYRAPARNAG